MASESGAEARSTIEMKTLLTPEMPLHAPYMMALILGRTRVLGTLSLGHAPQETTWKESYAGAWGPRLGVRPSIGRSSRTNLRLSPHFKHLRPLPQLRKVPRQVLHR